jgi:hypothetical protein
MSTPTPAPALTLAALHAAMAASYRVLAQAHREAARAFAPQQAGHVSHREAAAEAESIATALETAK